MKKIVIQTNSLERSGNLVSCLRTLFPTCEIEMQLVEMERYEDISRKPESEPKQRAHSPPLVAGSFNFYAAGE